jgi:hypothetical protein
MPYLWEIWDSLSCVDEDSIILEHPEKGGSERPRNVGDCADLHDIIFREK